ncbi:MAG: hypothetical protein CMF46_05010 [Legionellales bacterium]|nr:hypothetical protein [Legionellales bacterium]
MLSQSTKFTPLLITILSLFLLFSSSIFASSGGDQSEQAQQDTSETAATTSNFGGMAATVTSQMASFGSLLVSAAFVAGIGFTVVALFKFKQHKDNPTQVTIGTPAMLLFIGIFLIYLPNLISSGGATVGMSTMGDADGSLTFS